MGSSSYPSSCHLGSTVLTIYARAAITSPEVLKGEEEKAVLTVLPAAECLNWGTWSPRRIVNYRRSVLNVAYCSSVTSNSTAGFKRRSNRHPFHFLSLGLCSQFPRRTQGAGSHHFCFGRNKPMRAHVWTCYRMHQSAIVWVRCVPGSSPDDPPFWKSLRRRPWVWGWSTGPQFFFTV